MPRRPAMRARATAISSRRRRAGNSAGCGSWIMSVSTIGVLKMSAQTRAAFRHEPAEIESPFMRDVIAGLAARPKRLSPKYFYDEAGARLFEEITALPEYYPTRCELEILRERASDIARF